MRLDPSPRTPSGSSSSDTFSSSGADQADITELLPRALAGVELHTFAVGRDMLARLAATLGLEDSDLEVAFASEHGARFFQAYAVRAPAVDADRLLEAFANSAYDMADGEVTTSDVVVGGRPVTLVFQASTAARLGTYYAYTADGVIFIVQAMDPAVADEVLAALR